MATAPPFTNMRTLFPLSLLLTAVLSTGCEPTCKATCEKLVECEDVDSPRLSWVECTEACEDQERLYEQWTDGAKKEGFSELKYCIEDAECSDIADGECYDSDLYIW
jgi:hypothetical protein